MGGIGDVRAELIAVALLKCPWVHDLRAVVEVCGDKSLGVVLVARNPSRVSALPIPMRANAIGYQASSPAVSGPAVP
jgi:hypothetical protein